MEYSDVQTLVNGYAAINNGWQEEIVIPAPAAGSSSITRLIPGETWEKVLAGYVTLTNSATVATRELFIVFADGDGNTMYETQALEGSAAGVTSQVAFAVGGPQILSTAGLSVASMPELLLKSGWQFQINGVGIQADDVLSGMRLIVQRFPSNIASGDYIHELREHWMRAWEQLTRQATSPGG